ncbi:MAG: hypothetical protein AAB267_05480, partial [Candidatus Desantisbacteria bacterium]
TIEGRGYGSETLRICFGTHQTITTTLSTENGTFSVTFVIDTQEQGETVITVFGTDSNELDTTVFTIDSEITLLEPESGVVGTTVTIEGTGFSGSQTIAINFGTHQTITTTTSSINGTFSVTFRIDTQPAGMTEVSAVDEYENSDCTEFEILSEITKVSPKSGYVGSIVTVEGVGYTQYETVTISFGTHETITTVPAGINGTFSITFIISTQTVQTKVITAVGSLDTDLYYIIPEITTLIPGDGGVGQPITIMGTGFGSETVRIDFGTHQTITTAIANTNGTFSVTFIATAQTAGSTTITAQGNQTQEFDTTTFRITGGITLITPQSGFVGDVITVEGKGFKTGETLSISFGTDLTITTTTVEPNGTFSLTFRISTQVYGPKTIIALDQTGNTGSGMATILYHITSIQQATDTVGADVTVEGTGFDGSSLITIDFGTSQTITTTMTSGNGTFSTTFKVNTQPEGSKDVSVTDSTGHLSTTLFTIIARITELVPQSEPAGRPVTIAGTGYRQGEIVRIDFGTPVTIATATASANGTFSVTFTTIQQPIGSTVITAQGLNSSQVATTVFIIKAEISSISPLSGVVGTEVVVKGTGFNSTEEIH